MATISEERIEEYKRELLQLVTNPDHRKLIEAYIHPNPVENMEKVLGEILLEVLRNDEN
jgi:hypothetical protein